MDHAPPDRTKPSCLEVNLQKKYPDNLSIRSREALKTIVPNIYIFVLILVISGLDHFGKNSDFEIKKRTPFWAQLELKKSQSLSVDRHRIPSDSLFSAAT